MRPHSFRFSSPALSDTMACLTEAPAPSLDVTFQYFFTALGADCWTLAAACLELKPLLSRSKSEPARTLHFQRNYGVETRQETLYIPAGSLNAEALVSLEIGPPDKRVSIAKTYKLTGTKFLRHCTVAVFAKDAVKEGLPLPSNPGVVKDIMSLSKRKWNIRVWRNAVEWAAANNVDVDKLTSTNVAEAKKRLDAEDAADFDTLFAKIHFQMGNMVRRRRYLRRRAAFLDAHAAVVRFKRVDVTVGEDVTMGEDQNEHQNEGGDVDDKVWDEFSADQYAELDAGATPDAVEKMKRKACDMETAPADRSTRLRVLDGVPDGTALEGVVVRERGVVRIRVQGGEEWFEMPL